MAVSFTPDKPALDFERHEKTFGLRPGLMKALVQAESAGDPNAVSSAGARGVGQFMPAMVQHYKVDMSNPDDQLRASAQYMSDLLKQYGGNERAALAHYNGGAANAQFQLTGVEPPSTAVSPKNRAVNQDYVRNIMAASKGKIDFEADDTPSAAPAPAVYTDDVRIPPSSVPVAPTPAPMVGAPGALKSGIIGAQEGLTAGLGKYVTAGSAYLADRIPGVGTGKDVTWDEALGATRNVYTSAQEQNPGTYYGGNIAGGTGLAILSGGTSVPGLAARGAAMGAVQGATANPYTDAGDLAIDTLGGAALGGVLGAGGAYVSRAIPKVQGALAKKLVTGNARQGLDTASAGMDDAFAAWRAANPSMAHLSDAAVLKTAKKGTAPVKPEPVPAKVLAGMTRPELDAFLASRRAVPGADDTSAALLAAKRAVTAAKTNLTKLSGKPDSALMEQAKRLLATANEQTRAEAMPALKTIGRNTAVGAGLGSMAGAPIHGGVAGAANAIMQPDVAMPLARAAVTHGVTAPLYAPNIGRAAQALPGVVPAPVIEDTRTRLQKLADDHRPRGGQ